MQLRNELLGYLDTLSLRTLTLRVPALAGEPRAGFCCDLCGELCNSRPEPLAAGKPWVESDEQLADVRRGRGADRFGRSNNMWSDGDSPPEQGAVAEHLRRLQEHLAEIDGALGQLGEQISEAEQKSKYVIREVVPVVPQT